MTGDKVDTPQRLETKSGFRKYDPPVSPLQTEPLFTPSERRTLQRLLDQEWQRVNRERERDTRHLNTTALSYLQDLESLQRKLTA